MGTTSPDLLITIDRSQPRGLRAQIEDALRDAICAGRLDVGSSLPSTRALAADLGVTRGVIVEAYDQLVAEGYLTSRPGSGTVVSPSAQIDRPLRGASSDTVPHLIEFRTGRPALDLFPRTAWLRATRKALHTLPASDLQYGDPLGWKPLRATLADYLARVRGVRAEAGQIMVCDGFGHGFQLLTGALRALGHDRVAVEEPGYNGPHSLLDVMQLRVSPVDVDEEGLRVDKLRRSPARAVVVTPAHQSPTGVVLSPPRRHALVDWAHDVDGYVIEDDYDAEYRYDRRPVGAVQGIAPERVVYGGTTSKTLAPGVRLGWMVLPPDLVEPVRAHRLATGGRTSALLQATFDVFLSSGDLDRHLRRTRRVYLQRRDQLIEALARWFPDAVPSGISAGMHVLVTLPPHLDEARFAARALELGVRVFPLSEYRTRRRTDLPGGVVLGYGGITPAEIDAGARLLGEAANSV